MKLTRTLLAIAATGFVAAPAAAQQVSMMTGPQGGVWVPLGGALKGMWEKSVSGLRVSVQPGAGIANVVAVHSNKAHIGFANTITTVDGLAGREPYKEKMKNVCNVANIYPQYYQVVVAANSGINSIADLKGKSLVTQPRGNTGEIVTQHILRAHGMDYKALGKANFIASYTDAVAMMKDGNAHVFTLGTTVPASAVMDLASARDIKLLGVDDKLLAAMRKINPGYSKVTVAANTYPKQAQAVDVIGYATHIVAQCDLNEDLVYNMVKTMAANVDTMAAVNKAIAGLTPKMMAQDVGVPLHAGARKFYREAKAL